MPCAGAELDETAAEAESLQNGEALVYTHKKFSVSTNDDRIIQVAPAHLNRMRVT